MILGNFLDDVTVLGTVGEVAVGLTGADLIADVRDIGYDIVHWEWTGSHILQTLIDSAAVPPVIGALLNIPGEAYRLREKKRSGLFSSPLTSRLELKSNTD